MWQASTRFTANNRSENCFFLAINKLQFALDITNIRRSTEKKNKIKHSRVDRETNFIELKRWYLWRYFLVPILLLALFTKKKYTSNNIKLIVRHNPRNVLLNGIEKRKFELVYDVSGKVFAFSENDTTRKWNEKLFHFCSILQFFSNSLLELIKFYELKFKWFYLFSIFCAFFVGRDVGTQSN